LQVGRLEVDVVRGVEVYRFCYADSWLDSLPTLYKLIPT